MHRADIDEPEDEPSLFKEVIVTVAAAVLLAVLVQAFLIKPYRIPSGSMEHTLRCGDRVLVDRVGFHFGEPDRGDVVVFKPPAGLGSDGKPDADVQPGDSEADSIEPEPSEPSEGENPVLTAAQAREEAKPVPYDEDYIKRIVGEPGDKVEVKAHRAFVNGKELKEPFLFPLGDTPLSTGDGTDFGPVTVPDDRYFMMGDNRANSRDSRFFGSVPRDFIIGRAFVIYWPPSHVGGLPDKEDGGDGSGQDPNCLETTIEGG